MSLILFGKGLLLGLAIAAPLGPISPSTGRASWNRVRPHMTHRPTTTASRENPEPRYLHLGILVTLASAMLLWTLLIRLGVVITRQLTTG